MNVTCRKVFLILVILCFAIVIQPPPISSEERDKPVISFGIIPIYTPNLMYERFQPLMDYLSRNTPYRFRMRLAKDYKGIISLLEEGSINIALLGGVSYVVARDKVNIVPILKPLSSQGKPFYRSIIVTREDRDINSLSDLKGRSFAFGSQWSTTAIVSIYYLYYNGIELNSLSSYFHLRYSDSVVREVLKGNYDAGAVMETAAHNYKDKGLKFVFVSEPIPALPVVTRKAAPKELIDAVKKALLSLDPNDPDHREMLKEWGEEIKYGFVEAKDSDYDRIGRIIEYLKRKGIYFRTDED